MLTEILLTLPADQLAALAAALPALEHLSESNADNPDGCRRAGEHAVACGRTLARPARPEEQARQARPGLG